MNVSFTGWVGCIKGYYGMAKSANTDQTAP